MSITCFLDRRRDKEVEMMKVVLFQYTRSSQSVDALVHQGPYQYNWINFTLTEWTNQGGE